MPPACAKNGYQVCHSEHSVATTFLTTKRELVGEPVIPFEPYLLIYLLVSTTLKL